MSTTFAMFRIPVETDEYGNIHTDYSEDDYLEVAFRASHGMSWKNGLGKIQHNFKDDAKVYPLDNTAQGVYTVQDIRNEIDSQENQNTF